MEYIDQFLTRQRVVILASFVQNSNICLKLMVLNNSYPFRPYKDFEVNDLCHKFIDSK